MKFLGSRKEKVQVVAFLCTMIPSFAFLRHRRLASSVVTTCCKATRLLPDMTCWSIDKVTKTTTTILQENGVIEPEESVNHLLAASLGLPWETGFRDVRRLGKSTMTKQQYQDFHVKIDRRLKHEPLQYILGQWEFLDYTITVRPPLLSPRPETEELVMLIVEDTTESPVHILDIGCGTGVIGLSLAEKLPEATVDAIDIDPVAIDTSRENARRILSPSEVSCYTATLASAKEFNPSHNYDIVVSNPPYIPEADMQTLSTGVVDYESREALCGGADGMDVIRDIVHNLPQWASPGATCWMEVDPSHPVMLREWLQGQSSKLHVEFDSSFLDMFGKERFIKLRVI